MTDRSTHRKASSNRPDGSDEWPRSEALSKDLELYVAAVEEFFPYVAAQLSMRQYAAVPGENYFAEEIEMEREVLRTQLAGPLPRAIRGSALVVLYSAFETTTLNSAKTLSRVLECPSFDPQSERGQFSIKAERYFSEIVKVKLFSGKHESAGIDTLKALRHSFVHRQSAVDTLPKWLRAEMTTPKSQLTQCDIHEGIWIPSIECVKGHAALMSDWGRRLIERTIDRVGLDTFL